MVERIRANLIKDKGRQAIWLAHGLYHESKHVQFFIYFRLKSHNPFSLSSLTESLSEDNISLPCSWRGTPTPRTFGDGLLALQAFVPGFILFLQLLLTTKTECIEEWLVRIIEIEMRGINGGLSVIEIGKESLTAEGQDLSQTLLNDYNTYLAPKAIKYYQKLKTRIYDKQFSHRYNGV